jgi:hypothetical protein
MKTMLITIQTAKPRNPLVAPSLKRKSGVHRVSGGAQRRQARMHLKREIQRLKESP